MASEVIAVARDGNRFLLAKLSDIESGENNGDAQVHDLDTSEYTDIQPLQVWFKWANWGHCVDLDYRELLGKLMLEGTTE